MSGGPARPGTGVASASVTDPVDLEASAVRTAREAEEALRRVTALVEALFAEVTATESLSPLAGRLLRAAAEPRPQRELSAQLGVDAARVSVLTSQLVERGLLRRTRGLGDLRVRRPELTPAGRDTVARIDQRMGARSPLSVNLDERQLRSLVRLLERVERGGAAHEPVGSSGEGE